ncbi:hypothetical protein GRAN_2328 [Granulicella sibirica]|uniref:Uncharacterized protein n=1 Tax=Granulicella sibirica TaxID=2479048 RepID=A0A4Q0T1P9_9BACT|nr:hypothetical protein GRAN_2328 [Granulicella sibirica]
MAFVNVCLLIGMSRCHDAHTENRNEEQQTQDNVLAWYSF